MKKYIYLAIIVSSISFSLGFSLRHIEWQNGTPKEYTKVVADFGGKQAEAMYSGCYWLEYRETDGPILAFNGAPDRWRYTIW